MFCLRDMRNTADYEITDSYQYNDVKEAIEYSKEIIKYLDSLQ